MEYIPDFSVPLVIGATGMEAICRNIKIIILTAQYSVPLDRAFAGDWAYIDSPAPRKTSLLVAHLMDAIEKYEPRVQVESIDFEYADQKSQLMEGALTPKVVFHLKKGVVL